MNLRINSITLDNFKGVKSQTFVFNGKNAEVSGQNASGKTTLATAWFFMMNNCDYALKSNPAIFPLDVEECKPTVTANLDIDGKPVRISKMQTRKVGKPDVNGVSKVAFTNSYSINDVPKSERDFKADLMELGLDFDKALALSHPDFFVSEKKDEQRKILFGMATDTSDYDIAVGMGDVPDVVNLLRDYKMEEITAMNKATLHKINEDYGKDGEILNAKIEGLESAKIDVDVAELELQKSALNEQIADIDMSLRDADEAEKAYNALHETLMKTKFDQADMVRNATAVHEEMKRVKMIEINKVKANQKDAIGKKRIYEDSIADLTRKVESLTAQLESARDEYRTTADMQMPNDATICKFCGQELPSDKVETLITEFEQRKENELQRLTEKGNKLKEQIIELKRNINEMSDIANSIHLEDYDEQIKKLTNEYDAFDDTKVSVEDDPNYIKFSNLIVEIEADIKNMSEASLKRTEARERKSDLEHQIHQIDIEISKMSLNDGIDRQIADLRSKQMVYEQNRADAEKILYQVDMVSRRKNELLTDSINKNFKMVQFKFFDYLKNGTYKECCDVYVDGKKLGESMNTALMLRAKLDICNGLANFYGQHYPIWLDNAEALDSINKASVESDSQVVMLCVSEDEKVVIR